MAAREHSVTPSLRWQRGEAPSPAGGEVEAPVAPMERRRMDRVLDSEEFRRYRDLIHGLAGIHYPDEKRELLSHRLRARLRATGARDHAAYLRLVQRPSQHEERQALLDAVTTHETSFFRCPRHWEWFRARVERHAAARRCAPLRVWSAAAANGAEPYTAAIVAHQVLGTGAASGVEILATDLSQRVLGEAARATWRDHALAQAPPGVVAHHFTRTANGELALDPALARVVRFRQHNLMDPVPAAFGTFDVVLLRNVMIYFDRASRERALHHVLAAVKPGGHLVLGEAESLLDVAHGLRLVQPSIFVRPDGAATSLLPAAPKR